MKIIFTFLREMLVVSKYLTTFAPQLRKYIFPDLVAQMAESVDALVSNTSGKRKQADGKGSVCSRNGTGIG